VENHPSEVSRKSDKKKKMELGWTHNEKTALDWNSKLYRRMSRPKRMWRRTIEDEIKSTRRSWKEVKRVAGNRNAWKLFRDALCSTRSKKDLMMMCINTTTWNTDDVDVTNYSLNFFIKLR